MHGFMQVQLTERREERQTHLTSFSFPSWSMMITWPADLGGVKVWRKSARAGDTMNDTRQVRPLVYTLVHTYIHTFASLAPHARPRGGQWPSRGCLSFDSTVLVAGSRFYMYLRLYSPVKKKRLSLSCSSRRCRPRPPSFHGERENMEVASGLSYQSREELVI